MVNFGLNSASILGIFLAVAGAGLYLLRSIRPELSRDHDIFFAAIGLLCGFILLFQGWRLDPILQFGQFLLTGSTIFFAVESIRMRSVATEQAKRNTPIVDDERTPSPVYRYRAELDELEAAEEQPPRRRLRGNQDPRKTRTDGYEDESPRRPPSRTDERPESGERQRKRRPRPETPPKSKPENFEATGEWEEKPRRTDGSRPTRPEKPENRPPETTSKPRKSRPPDEAGSRRNRDRDVEATPTDVDYRPVEDYPKEERDNSEDFD